MQSTNPSPSGRGLGEGRIGVVTSTLTRRAFNCLLRPVGLAFAPLTARRPLQEGEAFTGELFKVAHELIVLMFVFVVVGEYAGASKSPGRVDRWQLANTALSVPPLHSYSRKAAASLA